MARKRIPQEAFKGVIRRKEPVMLDGRLVYVYYIIGALVSEEELISEDERFLAGFSYGLQKLLLDVPGGKPNQPLGDPNDVFVKLGATEIEE